MRLLRSREPDPADTADSHVSSEPSRGGPFARRRPDPVADARNQTATRCIPRQPIGSCVSSSLRTRSTPPRFKLQ